MSSVSRRVLALTVLSTLYAVVACGSDDPERRPDRDGGTGGATSTGGARATGGAKSTGGTTSTGGARATGGALNTGGTSVPDASAGGTVSGPDASVDGSTDASPPPDAADAAPGDAGATGTFDDGFDGWNAVDLTSAGAGDGYGVVLTELNDLVWNPTGGIPGGYLSRVDTTSYSFFFNAPAKFRGDLSRYAGGALTFYMRSSHATWLQDSVVVIVGGPSSTVVVAPITAPGTAWTAYTVPLTAAGFRLGTAAGEAVDAPTFAAILADVRALRINGEWGANVEETVGFDSVTLVEGSVL